MYIGKEKLFVSTEALVTLFASPAVEIGAYICFPL